MILDSIKIYLPGALTKEILIFMAPGHLPALLVLTLQVKSVITDFERLKGNQLLIKAIKMQPNQTIINYFSLSLRITELTVITIFQTTIDNNNYYSFVLCKEKDRPTVTSS